jgi:hypothetical protein
LPLIDHPTGDTRPPVVGIEFEMDVRGVRTELRVDL